MTRTTLVGIAVGIVLAGCHGPPTVEMSIYKPAPRPTPRDPAKSELISGADVPRCPFEEIGSIVVGDYGAAWNDQQKLDLMRKRVAEAGADGVLRLAKASPGTIGEGKWQGVVFRCTDR